MYKLLYCFLKEKYKLDNDKIRELITQAKENHTLEEWYQVAILSYQDEMSKNAEILQNLE